MDPVRCAVLRAGSDPSTLAELRAAAHSTTGVTWVQTNDIAALTRDTDAVLIGSSAREVPALIERIVVFRRDRADCAVLATGRNFDVEHLTSIFQAGAHDFIGLPFSSEEFRARLHRALGLADVESHADVHELISARLPDFIGQSEIFRKQVAKLPTIAGCDVGVLIAGETGTGKEVCARAIHYLSARASRPWVAVNCGAIPLELIESELFGHVRGAYTHAHVSREGLIAQAEGGTLFLDDVDCLPVQAQSKLLRFLQEHEYRAVGENAMRCADVRVIAASNQNLTELLCRREFRQDLFYRLNVLTLTLPPLRDRREDIPILASHFLHRYAQETGRAPPSLSPLATRKLLAYEWPGNVRELQHVLRRALIQTAGPSLSPESIDVGRTATEMLPAESFRAAKARVVEQFERSYIERLLVECHGNVTHAAIEANKNRRAFFALIRKHGIEPHRFR